MMTPKERSPFAQALYELMITPEIYSIEEWCEIIDPWVTYKTERGGEIRTCGPEARGAPKTMALIQSWFDDKALPTSRQLSDIIWTCKEGNKAAFMAHLGNLGEKDLEFDAYVGRFKKGKELQEKALDHFYSILDQYIWDVSPIGRGMQQEVVGLYPHHKLSMKEPLIDNIIFRLFQTPARHLESVLWQVVKTITEAEKNNWYEKTPE